MKEKKRISSEGHSKRVALLPLLTGWNRQKKNILYNFCNMYNPHIIYDEDNRKYPFLMWFFGWAIQDTNPGFPGCDAIFVARGKSMESFEVYAGDGKWDSNMDPALWRPVLTAGNTWFDCWHVGDPSVVKNDGIYYMAFSSYAFDRDEIPSWGSGDTDGDLCCIMGAESGDGIHWEKSKKPILIWENEIGKNENLMIENGFYCGNYHRPSIMWDQGKWKMWFDYILHDEGYCIGYAENEGNFMDPGSWKIKRADESPVLKQFVNPDVIKIKDKYYMYGDPAVHHHGADPRLIGSKGWPARQITEAVSVNGIDWNITGWLNPDDDTPACQIPEAFVFEGKAYLLYACQIGGKPYDFRYNRIRYAVKSLDDFS